MAGAILRKRCSAALALAWIMLPGTILAATPPAEQAPCELHLWAANGMGRTIQSAQDNLSISWNGLSVANPLTRANKDGTEVHTLAATVDDPLPASRQLAVLSALDLPARLGTTGYHLVVHEQPLDSRTARSAAGRYIATTAVCYADLVLTDLDYSREYAHGQNLKAFFRFRDFGMGSAPVRRLATWAETKLAIRRDDPSADLAASDRELEQALVADLIKFAGYLGGLK